MLLRNSQAIHEHLDLLQNIRDNLDREIVTHEELAADAETVDAIVETSRGLPKFKTFKFKANPVSPEDINYVEGLCGVIEKWKDYQCKGNYYIYGVTCFDFDAILHLFTALYSTSTF